MENKKKTIVITALITFLCTLILFSFVLLRFVDKSDIVKRIVQQKYAGDIDNQKLDDYAAKGVVAALGDPHSQFLTKDESEAMFSEISGNYKGIGIEVFLNMQNQLEIASVFPDTPAYNAGLQPGDIIKAAGDIETTPETYNDILYYIRGISDNGKASDTIEITVERDGQEMKLQILRSDISVQTVSTKELDEIYYIRMTSFTDSTEKDFKAAMQNINTTDYKGLIIDLRDNPGGYLNVVVNIADYILPEGTIVYTSDKKGKTQYYNSDSSAVDIPIVVLINENSASASEILAAALHDNNKATLVGMKTYGKGSVQEMIKFPDDSAIKLTTAHYYTPSGICIDGIGINPDFEVALSDEGKTKTLSMLPVEEDAQLQKAIEVLKSK